MNSPNHGASPANASKAKREKEASIRRDETRQQSLGKSATPLAAQRAAAILDVLAGQRTTTEAAAALEISVNHYYLLERRALEGLMGACEPQEKGPKGPTLENQLQRLEQQLQQSRRECMRQAALVRATQRAVGLPAAEGDLVQRPRSSIPAAGQCSCGGPPTPGESCRSPVYHNGDRWQSECEPRRKRGVRCPRGSTPESDADSRPRLFDLTAGRSWRPRHFWEQGKGLR